MNMKKLIATLVAVAAIIAMTACQSQKENTSANKEVAETVVKPTVDNKAMALPPIVIYKTKADYSNLVPIQLNDDKTQVVSFPDPRDVYDRKRPTQLNDGFWLDNFGIGKNVVYTDYTFEEYAALQSPPGPDTLMQHIYELNPLTAYYVSNNDYSRTDGRSVEKLNEAIANNMAGFTAVEL